MLKLPPVPRSTSLCGTEAGDSRSEVRAAGAGGKTGCSPFPPFRREVSVLLGGPLAWFFPWFRSSCLESGLSTAVAG